MTGKPIAIYIHVPYCRTLCPYCDFVKERARGAVPEAFADALCREITAFEGADTASSVFFGGGTPSLMAPAMLEGICSALRGRFTFTPDAEWTLEANPDDVTPDLAQAWRAAGINRISLGVQSFDGRVLRYLGRRHDAAAAKRACETVAGVFPNWSLDLIFGAPPASAWAGTLARALDLAPPHLAAYGLTYEPGTPFGRMASRAISDDESLGLYQQLEQAMEGGGYQHYEISNFALPGCESRHNLVYWRNESYAGFGAGAWSYVGGVRARNHSSVDAWLRAPGDKAESEGISLAEEKAETLIQHFRLRTGISREYYRDRFGTEIEQDFGKALRTLEQQELLQRDADGFQPTRRGFYMNNEIGLVLVDALAAA